MSKLDVIKKIFLKANKCFFSSFFWLFERPMKRCEQFHTYLNEVLLLKLLQKLQYAAIQLPGLTFL